MNKYQKIHIGTGSTIQDKNIIVKLEQDVESLEILSLKINTEDFYQNFNSDFGVVIGRVIANNGIGIPNAKISVFIPLNEEDQDNGDVLSIYPFKTPRTKNLDGKRYNLLPRVSKIDPETNQKRPRQAFGSLPTKEEFLTNSTFLEVYKKYYKYTTVTNNSGDYMIYGVPVGTQTVHMSCDITDIGRFSMNPASMVTNLGYSSNLFTENNTIIKPSNDIEDLPNIETQEISVDVIPFWGDTNNFQIGITRQDFRIRAQLTNTFTIFGSVFTDGDDYMWGTDIDNDNNLSPLELYRMRGGSNGVAIATKRIGNITEKIYYYDNSVSDTDITNNNINPATNMRLLDPSEYTIFKRNGDFVFIINCNRRKIILNENGDEIEVDDNYDGGVYTEFRGFITLEYTEDDIPMNFSENIGVDDGDLRPIRMKVKIPQYDLDSYAQRKSDRSTNRNWAWKNQTFTFKYGKYYSIAKFISTVGNYTSGSNRDIRDDWNNENDYTNNRFQKFDVVNNPRNREPLTTVGIIGVDNNFNSQNNLYQFPSNYVDDRGWDIFGANWLNFSIYLPQYAWFVNGSNNNEDTGGLKTNTHFTDLYKDDDFLVFDNESVFIGENNDYRYFGRCDIHYTDFIETPLSDLQNIINNDLPKGFKSNNITFDFVNPNNYKNYIDDFPINEDNIIYGGKPNDSNSYFFRGYGESDCIGFLRELNILD